MAPFGNRGLSFGEPFRDDSSMKASRNHVLKSFAVVLLLAAAVSSILFFPSMRGWFESFNRWAGGQGAAGLLIFALGYAVATVLFVPGSPMTLAGGFVFGLWHGFLARGNVTLLTNGTAGIPGGQDWLC